MYYLVTAAPFLLAHGTYSYHELPREKALHWLEEHHKGLKVATVIPASPYQQFQLAPNAQFVQMLAQHIDRYIGQAAVPLPALDHGDEVLVVHHQPLPGRPGTHQAVTIETLNFALFKRHADHPAAL